MIIKHLETGPLAVNTYIVGDEKAGEAIVVDPGGNADLIKKLLDDNHLKCVMIYNTHTHWDHIGGNAELKELTGAPIVTHEDEAPGLANAAAQARFFGMSAQSSPAADRFVKQDENFNIGEIEFRVIELPGHSPCAVGLVFEGHVIVGDALFAGSIGRTDFPGGDFELLISKIKEQIFTLPPKTIVLPGHGPATTVEREKGFNPFF